MRRWQGEGLSVGTVKNRLSHLRWWAGKIGKPFALPEGNGRLGVENRTYVQGQGKQTALDPDKLAQVKDEHLRLSLKLQAQFGLRREEAIKFQPAYVPSAPTAVSRTHRLEAAPCRRPKAGGIDT